MTFKRLLKVRKVFFPYVGDCFIASELFADMGNQPEGEK
jgi:hypothetical protein